jgi:predicted nucleotidyltransferase
VARGDADENSDVDLLIDMAEEKSLFDLLRFKDEMQTLCRRKVDTVQIEAVRNKLRRRYMLEHVVNL